MNLAGTPGSKSGFVSEAKKYRVCKFICLTDMRKTMDIIIRKQYHDQVMRQLHSLTSVTCSNVTSPLTHRYGNRKATRCGYLCILNANAFRKY